MAQLLDTECGELECSHKCTKYLEGGSCPPLRFSGRAYIFLPNYTSNLIRILPIYYIQIRYYWPGCHFSGARALPTQVGGTRAELAHRTSYRVPEKPLDHDHV